MLGLSGKCPLLLSSQHAFLKEGTTTDYAAVQHILEWQGTSLTAEEQEQLQAYLLELTARDFFVLRHPLAEQLLAFDQEVELSFSQPVWGDSANLARVSLQQSGEVVEAQIRVDGRKLWVKPAADFAPGASYELVIGAGLESWGQRSMGAEQRIPLQIAELQALCWRGIISGQ